MIYKSRTRSIRLRDGRKLKYRIQGPTILNDTPSQISSLPVVFAFHAMFMSATSMLTTTTADYAVVAVYRPGYRGSSPVDIGEYTYKDFASDISELAKSLNISRFVVVGHSSGGPNALACAAILDDCVAALGTLASDPEYHQCPNVEYCLFMDCWIGIWVPRLLKLLVPCLKVANGMKNDYWLERQAYPFRLESIQQPCLVIAGEDDTMVPPEVTVQIHNRLQNSRFRVLKGKQHNDLLSEAVLDKTYRDVLELGGLLPTTKRSTSLTIGESQ